MTMQAALIEEAFKPLKITEIPKPKCPSKGVVLKNLYAGVCHSDIHLIDDEIPLGRGQFFRRRDHLGDAYVGLILGHEICGRIEEIGSDVDSSFSLKVGDNVMVFPWVGCGECASCKAGFSNTCLDSRGRTVDIGQNPNKPGGYQQYMPVSDVSYLEKVPDNIALKQACVLPCSASTAFNAVEQAASGIEFGLKLAEKAKVLIIGVGGVGLWSLKLLNAIYGSKIDVYVLDKTEENLTVALNNGGKAAESSKAENGNWNVSSDGVNMKFNAVLDFVANSVTSMIAFDSLTIHGRQVCIGMFGGIFGAAVPLIIGKEAIISGVRATSAGSFRRCVKVVSDNSIPFEALEEIEFSEINRVIDLMRDGKSKGRYVIKF